jgi:hypothetical protein
MGLNFAEQGRTMKFQFYEEDKSLNAAANAGGCGLTALESAAVAVWQSNDGYEFSFHTGYHGKGAQHYVYVREKGSTQVKNCARVMIPGGATEGSLKAAYLRDASAVVVANGPIFLRFAKEYSGEA